MFGASRVGGVAVAVAVGFLAACASDRAAEVASLAAADGAVERQRGDDGAWQAAAVGDRFRLGDAVRTGAASTAVVDLRGAGSIALDPDTVLRFQRTPAAELDLDVETGAVEIEVVAAALEIETAIGPARIERNTTVRLSAGEGGALGIEVLVGRVVMEELRAGAAPRALTAGDRVTAVRDERGKPRVEPAPAPPAPDAAPPATPGAVAATVTGSGAEAHDGSTWAAMRAGDTELAPGTRVRVRGDSTVELRRRGARAVVSSGGEVVVGEEGGPLVEATRGSVTATAGDDEHVVIAVPGGTIVVRARPGGSEVEVAVDGGRADVRARRGRVAVGGDELRAGETAELARDGDVTVSGRIPARVAFSLAAGESATVHDLRAPTGVRVDFSAACAGHGTVEVATARGSFDRPVVASPGNGAANVELPTGTSRYRVVCDGARAPAASGTIRVHRDSPRRKLPSKPPHNVLDANGRKYKVMYQNLLPELTMRWPDAPAGAATLHVQPDGGAVRTVTARAARHTFASGALGEGSYAWWFEVGGRRSPETRLTIDFDNAAATAYVKDVSIVDGGVRVEGAVIDEWTATAYGERLAVDRHQRFVAIIAPRPGEDAIALRIAHPDRGVHYYLLQSEAKAEGR